MTATLCFFIFDSDCEILQHFARDAKEAQASMYPDEIAVPGVALWDANGTLLAAREQTFAELN